MLESFFGPVVRTVSHAQLLSARLLGIQPRAKPIEPFSLLARQTGTAHAAAATARLPIGSPRRDGPKRPPLAPAKGNAPKGIAEAVTEERARCGRIMAAGIECDCVEQAGTFAFDTDITADAACAALQAGKAAQDRTIAAAVAAAAVKPTRPSLAQLFAAENIPIVQPECVDLPAVDPSIMAASAILASAAAFRGEPIESIPRLSLRSNHGTRGHTQSGPPGPVM